MASGPKEKDSRPRWPTTILHVSLQAFFFLLCLYWYYHIPPTGKPVLALAVVAVIMTISEITPFLKGIWLVLVFLLMFLENKSIDKDHAEAESLRREASLRDNQLMSTTNQLVTSVGVLLPQMAATKAELANLRGELRTAEAANATQKAAELRAEIDKVEQKANDDSRQLLLTLTQQVENQLANTYYNWHSEQDNFGTVNRKLARSDFDSKYSQMINGYQGSATPVLATAAILRKQLIDLLPLSERTKADNEPDSLFPAGNHPTDPAQLLNISMYLDHLRIRVSQHSPQVPPK